MLLAGCQTPPASTPSAARTDTPTKTVTTNTVGKIGPGMNAQGEVVDSSKVESGYGRTITGLDGWEGEITGTPAPNSKFSQLQIGMSRQRVLDILGEPTDQGRYMTGKAWIPFYFGSDRSRHELAYKGMGRLIFAASGGFDTNAHLIWIIHNANDSGYR